MYPTKISLYLQIQGWCSDMEKLTLIRLGIQNTTKAIEQLTANLAELRVQEQLALLEIEVEEELKGDFQL